MAMALKTCSVCEKQFLVKFRFQIEQREGQTIHYCSQTCRQAESHARGEAECATCGKVFEPRFAFQQATQQGRQVHFCSMECRTPVEEDVRRRVVTREDSTHGLTRKRRQTYTIELFLSNLAGTPRTLTVQERIPVSEIEAVQVTLIDADGGELDARDGLVRYTITVPARGHMGRTLRYRLASFRDAGLAIGAAR